MTRASQPLTRGLKSAGHIESPVPHLQEAQGAAARIVSLQRELLTLKAENLAITQAKRLGYGIAALLSAFLAIFFFFGWAGYALHERGMGSFWVAGAAFLFFGLISAAAVWAAWRNPL